jgi:hypothetical protein
MRSHRRTNKFFLLAFPIALAIAITTLPSQSYNTAISAGQDRPDKKKESQDNQMPVATFNASDPADPAVRDLRRVRSSRHDKRRPQPLSELPAGIEELPLTSHWAWGMVALPSTQSDAVVIGEVTDAQAYLSNDRTGVYSEFTVRVKEVLKNLNQVSLIPSEAVILEREGVPYDFHPGAFNDTALFIKVCPSLVVSMCCS